MTKLTLVTCLSAVGVGLAYYYFLGGTLSALIVAAITFLPIDQIYYRIYIHKGAVPIVLAGKEDDEASMGDSPSDDRVMLDLKDPNDSNDTNDTNDTSDK